MSNAIAELFKNMGIELDEEDMDDSSGFVSNFEVENPVSGIRGIKPEFGQNHVCCFPTWLRLPFNPLTGKKLKKGKYFSTMGTGATSDEIIQGICDAAEIDVEYAENIKEMLKVNKYDEIKLEYNKETGALSPETFSAFEKYANYYIVQEYTQRISISEEKRVTRLAFMPTTDTGSIDFDNCDPDYSLRYSAEAALLAKELEEVVSEMKEKGEPKKVIEERERTVRGSKCVTPPRITSVIVAFCFESDDSGALTPPEMAKYKDTNTGLKYSLRYFGITQEMLKTLQGISKRDTFKYLSFIPAIRQVPGTSPEIPNLGIAIGKSTFVAMGSKLSAEGQIPDLKKRIEEVQKDEKSLDVDIIKASINKFKPIKKEEVIAAYANGLSSYSRALGDKVFIMANREVLSVVGRDLGLKQIKNSVNKEESITVEFKEDKNDMEEYYDTEDLGSAPESESISASDFVD